MNALDSLEKGEIKELLSKGWITHDAMWFAHCLEEVGIEKTNKINRAAVKSMSTIEALRVKKALGFHKDTMDSFDELIAFLEGAMDLVLAKFMHFTLSVPEKNVIHWEMDSEDCFAYKGISRMGVIEHYECGVLYRVETWLKALHIDYEMRPAVGKCMMHLSGKCAGDFIFRLA